MRVLRLELPVLIVLAVAGCVAQTSSNESATVTAADVVARARLGNATEGVTFIDRGPLANHAVVIDGDEVLAIATTGPARDPQLLFHPSDLGLTPPPRDVGFVGRDRHLVFNDLQHLDHLVFTDLDGTLVDELTISYPPGSYPDHVEGITVLPGGAIAMLTWRFAAMVEVRIEIIDPASGTVTSEIVVDPSIAGAGVTALVDDGDSFLVSPVDQEIYRIGLDGTVIEGPVVVGELQSIEGLTAARGGFYAADYAAGTLIAFDQQLHRRPARDRDYLIGFGFSRIGGVTWEDDSESLRVSAQLAGVRGARIAEVSEALDSLAVVATLPTFDGIMTDLSAIPAEDLLVAGSAFSPSGLLFIDDASQVVGDLDFGGQIPIRVAYLAPTDELAVVFNGDFTGIHFFDRDGAPTRSIDVAPFGAVTVAGLDLDDTGVTPGLVIADGSGTVYRTDLDGVLLDSDDYRPALGDAFSIAGLAVQRGGAHPGALAFSDGDTNEVVIVDR